MSQKIEEFKKYIKENPNLKIKVDKRETTWQELFEEWTIVGKVDTGGESVKETVKTTSNIPVTKEMAQLGDMIKTCVNYVKKINPDSISKTVTNIQKLMALVAGIGAANTVKAAKGNKMTGDPLFDKKFDDWY